MERLAVKMDQYLNKIKKILDEIQISDRYGKELTYEAGLGNIADCIQKCKYTKKTLYICGNGGSAGIAQHMTADFLKNGGLRTYSMYGQPTVTCISNDLTYEYVFCKQIEMLGNEDDVLIAISSSGESENIVKAVDAMRKLGGKVITFTGFKAQNRIRRMGDFNVYIPVEHYGMVESIHNLILQQLVDTIVEKDGVAMKLD